MLRIVESVSRIAPSLIEKYRVITPAGMGHHVEAGIMNAGIKPVQQNVAVTGTAITVQCLGRDSAVCHKVIDLVGKGDVIVIDRGGDMKYACWGEMMTIAAYKRGAAAVIVDGLATDIQYIRQCPMPVFCRGFTPLTTQISGKQGGINVPIVCGGLSSTPAISSAAMTTASPPCRPIRQRSFIHFSRRRRTAMQRGATSFWPANCPRSCRALTS